VDGDVVVRLEENPVTTAGAVARAKATAVPASETLPWLISAVLVGLALYFFIGIDQGAVSVFGDTSYIHELVHDARHFLGFPCH
jgi:cobalt transporter subunit CbtB